MRTAFFRDGSPDCPLVAIADFEPAEVVTLRSEVMSLASGESTSAVLEGDVHLTLQVGKRDIGILNRGTSRLVCVLRPLAWEQVADLLEPFTEPGQQGFQWLDQTGDVKLLISRTGKW